MARTRNIKPGFFTNDKLLECEPLARILFAGLWCHADREGRIEDRPKKFKIEILPADECNVVALLDQLERGEFIVRYQVGEVRYIAVPTFGKHQNPHKKEVVSTIPAPGQHRAGTGPGRKKKQAGVPPGDGEPGLLPSSFPSPPSLPPNPPQAGGSDASQGSGEEPDRRSPRAKGENPRAVGKAAETRALAEETQAIRDKRRALWSDRLMQYRAGGKWQTTWGAEPWSGNLGCLVPLDMRDEFGSARLEVEQPGFLKSAARPAPDDEAALAARYEELTERRTA